MVAVFLFISQHNRPVGNHQNFVLSQIKHRGKTNFFGYKGLSVSLIILELTKGKLRECKSSMQGSF